MRASPLPFEAACAKLGVILDSRRFAVQQCPHVAVEVAVWRLLVAVARDCRAGVLVGVAFVRRLQRATARRARRFAIKN